MSELVRAAREERLSILCAVPTGRLPYPVMWVIARFDKAIRLALEYVGREERVSCEKAKRELGGTMLPVKQTVLDTRPA